MCFDELGCRCQLRQHQQSGVQGEGRWQLVFELEDIEKDSSLLLRKMTFLQHQSKSTKNRFQAGDVIYGNLCPYFNKALIAAEPSYCMTEIMHIKAGIRIETWKSGCQIPIKLSFRKLGNWGQIPREIGVRFQ
jgi:hypothetical protein